MLQFFSYQIPARNSEAYSAQQNHPDKVYMAKNVGKGIGKTRFKDAKMLICLFFRQGGQKLRKKLSFLADGKKTKISSKMTIKSLGIAEISPYKALTKPSVFKN
ncbi:MAG: hypothetical protein AAGF54_00475 [Pseudomonadota bacterium]